MELKEFIKEVITSISEATTELQSDLAEQGVLVTPAGMLAGADLRAGGTDDGAAGRPVEKIEFDLAVTAAEPGGDATGIRVVAAPSVRDPGDTGGADGVSRVAFSLAISYPPVREEAARRETPRSGRGKPREKPASSRKWTRF